MTEPTVTCLRCDQQGRTATMTHDEFIASLMQIPGAVLKNAETAWQVALNGAKPTQCGNCTPSVRSKARPK